MPLVIVTGFPSSGKSRRAGELKDYLEKERGKTVLIVSENEIVGKEKNKILNDSRLEKDLRGSLKSDVLRQLNRETVVILDAGNYIKGFRYELYCASKQIKTPHCILHTLSPIDQAWKWNQERPESEQYTKEVFDGLVMRYEAPNSSNRWDSPMFTLLPEDSPLPSDAIYEALFTRKPPPPNQSTETQPLSSTNFLYELDQTTQEVTTVIMNSQKILVEGDDIKIPGSTESISLGRKVTLGELTRARRQFISYTKLHPVEDTGKLTSLFVQYLNKTLG